MKSYSLWLGGSLAKRWRSFEGFGISRRIGYNFHRYQECGLQGLSDRSPRPYRYAHQLPFQMENYILNAKRERCCADSHSY